MPLITDLTRLTVSFALAIALIGCLCDDCRAQRTRGWLHRQSNLSNSLKSGLTDQTAVRGDSTSGQFATPTPEMKYQMDWRRDPTFNFGTPQYPKYFGGFHYSQYYNLGIPNGDAGFRGNGVYWTPW